MIVMFFPMGYAASVDMPSLTGDQVLMFVYAALIIGIAIFFAVQFLLAGIHVWYKDMQYEETLLNRIDLFCIDSIAGYFAALISYWITVGWFKIINNGAFSSINIITALLYYAVILITLCMLLGIMFYLFVYGCLVCIPFLIAGVLMSAIPSLLGSILFFILALGLEILTIIIIWQKISIPILKASVWLMKLPFRLMISLLGSMLKKA